MQFVFSFGSRVALSMLETYCCESELSDSRQFLDVQWIIPDIVMCRLYCIFRVLYPFTEHWCFKMHALHSTQTSYQASFCSNTVCISWYSGFVRFSPDLKSSYSLYTVLFVALVSTKIRAVSTNRLLPIQFKSCEFFRNRTARLLDAVHNHLFYFQQICPF